MSLYPAFPVVKVLHPLHKLVLMSGTSNYTVLHFDDGSQVLYAKTLRLFEEGLPSHLFVRISKSHLVRRDYICASNSKEVLLMNGQRLKVSRRRKIKQLTTFL